MFRKVFASLSFVALAFVFVLAPLDVSIAQDSAPAASGFVTCDGVDCSFCNLVEMANIIIIWLFGILFLIFAVIMFSAGFGLVTAGGNEVALDAAKKKFQNALIGIVIIMAAWLLIDVIMKGLVGGGDLKDKDGNPVAVGEMSGWGPWSEVECTKQTTAIEWAGDPDFDPTAPPATGPRPAACTGGDCVQLSSNACVDDANTNCGISPDLVNKINAFHGDVVAAGIGDAGVTEGMPPTVTHQSQCHNNGTCIDYSRPGGMTGPQINTVADAARAHGLRPVYEVKTQAQKDALVSQGANPDNIKVISKITGPHFSIYGY